MMARPSGVLVRLVATGAVLLGGAFGGTAWGALPSSPEAQRQLGRDLGAQAYIYGVPLVDLALRRASTTSVDVAVDGSGAAPVNQLAKSGYEAGGPNVIPAPSTDTIYTSMMLDLRREPQVLRIPPVADGRFWDMEFLDPYTNVFAYLGTRCNGATPPPFPEALEACAATTGQAGGDFAIVGPRWKGTLPTGLIAVRSPYDRIWVGGRTLVGGDASQADIDAAIAVQKTYRLQPLSTYPADWSPPPPRRPSLVLKTQPDPVATKRGLRWFAYLNRQMAINRPPARDRPLLRRLREVGIGAGLTPRLVRLPGPVKQGLREGIKVANLRIKAELAKGTRNAVARTNGWSVPPPNTGNFGTDYLTRAVLDVYGIGANRPIEGMYPSAFVDVDGRPLNGRYNYELTFAAPSGTPPVQTGGFWSLTVYDSQMFLVARPWAIGNRSGLVTESDGSIKVRLQSTAPSSGNWLLTPAPDRSANPPVTGAFNLTMRIYIPQQSVFSGTWTYPTVRRVQ
jgi:hypothetical protein